MARHISILDMSDDVLFGILYSGYIGFDWHTLRKVVMTCKTFYRLGCRRIAKLVLKEEENVIDITKQLSGLVFIDFGYNSNKDWAPHTFAALRHSFNSLRSLILRGTLVSDRAMDCILDLQKEINLYSLDLSKSISFTRSLISDRALLAFQFCHQMRWLNLSMTNITDDSMQLISTSFPRLELLGLQCCPRITNRGIDHLNNLPLKFLDIIGCSSLAFAAPGFSFLTNQNCRLFQTLETFACAYTPGFNNMIAMTMLSLPNLKLLDCRTHKSWQQQTGGLSNDILDRLRGKLVVLVYKQEDQLKLGLHMSINITEQRPALEAHWAHFNWPYQKQHIEHYNL
jgi:hypothetical protein